LLETTTFFITNFPERYGAKALFNAFHNYGDVMEVVIPAKRDKGGRRFGFARFARVIDPTTLENSLVNIVFGGYKISANLSVSIVRTIDMSPSTSRGRIIDSPHAMLNPFQHLSRGLWSIHTLKW
jgi:hypothetical protein